MTTDHKFVWLKVIASIALIVTLGYFLGMGGCEAEDADVLEAIRGAGLTQPELGGVDLMACSKNEASRHFTAKNQQGDRVSGTVCCGLIGKGCTVRWGR